jgi:hypothetical protein
MRKLPLALVFAGYSLKGARVALVATYYSTYYFTFLLFYVFASVSSNARALRDHKYMQPLLAQRLSISTYSITARFLLI